MSLREHLTALPDDLAGAIDATYTATTDHYLKEEWDDAQVDAGRFCEATLRYMQWKRKGSYTPIDGNSKPNRKSEVQKCRDDTQLAATLRQQIPQAVELVMDFRNNRNSAHLGDIDANRLDAGTVVSVVTWLIGEIIRLETQQQPADVQALLNRLAEPYVPLIQHIGDTPVILDPSMGIDDQVLVFLYQAGGVVDIATLREWAGYSHSTRWRTVVIARLAKAKLVFVDKQSQVHLLHPGAARAQELLVELS